MRHDPLCLCTCSELALSYCLLPSSPLFICHSSTLTWSVAFFALNMLSVFLCFFLSCPSFIIKPELRLIINVRSNFLKIKGKTIKNSGERRWKWRKNCRQKLLFACLENSTEVVLKCIMLPKEPWLATINENESKARGGTRDRFWL